jgi:adenine-specific DNA-methyltransferase
VTTPYHSLYWAHRLTLRGSGSSVAGISRSIASARVDLNPHQVDAALFAVRAPLAHGVILADEVGLGKTIEAGIVIAQKWAERRRRILLILPATLRKQWQQELAEKFGLPSEIMESAIFNAARRSGATNPLDHAGTIIACSYQFAAAKASEIACVPWDLVVIDEAHRMRNVYRPASKIARAIADAIQDRQTLMLTATPLQNSLMELYGLVSVIDPHVFGDERSFRERFVRQGTDENARDVLLRERLRPLCTRTLRKQVLEYIRFTRRIPITQEFTPSAAEHRLYELVSAYLQRDTLMALPVSQRALMTLVLRKLLASSTFAIAGTLRKLVTRLGTTTGDATDDLVDDFEALDELTDEWPEESPSPEQATKKAVTELTLAEMRELQDYAELAESITENAKGQALLKVLRTALNKAQSLGGSRKAVVFTESRRTQRYLLELLNQNGYADDIVLMNGTNTDPASKEIYRRWIDRHAGSGLASGSRSADTKAAIVEEFRDHASILIATESVAEGVNLQFCSLVVNYDLPWNPQRVEQRIGRCHRYGQQHDVVVVNFVNLRNAADQRVYELLAQKFKLFDGVFGASDEVLGALGSGMDLERRIAQVYQDCRTENQINTAFDQLQLALEDQIQARMASTRDALFANFDDEVQKRLQVYRDEAEAALDERQRWLLDLTRAELNGDAEFETDAPRFRYAGPLGPSGWYNLDWRDAAARDDIFYKLEERLASTLVDRVLQRDLRPAVLHLNYDAYGAAVSALAPLRGKSGMLDLTKLTTSSLQQEEFLLLSGCTIEGEEIDQDICEKLLALPARISEGECAGIDDAIRATRERRIATARAEVTARNRKYFEEELEKLERWVDDMHLSLTREIRELDKALKETKREGRAAPTLAGKLAAQKAVKTLEQQRNRKRRDLFDAQDAIDDRREQMIAAIEQQLEQRNTLQQIFTIRWVLN